MARGRKPSASGSKKMKRGNKSGSIFKTKENRRKPWRVQVSLGAVKMADGSYRMKRKTLGYYATEAEAIVELSKYLEGEYSIQETYTFKDIYEMWSKKYFDTLKGNSGERSYSMALNHVAPLWPRNFASLSIQDMRDAIDAPDNSPATKQRIKSMLNMMYDFAVEAEIVPINKARQFSLKGIGKERKKVQKDKIPISLEHISLLKQNEDYGYVRMILIGIYTGFRPSEICMLERQNVHLDENYIIGGMKTEAGENRYVPIHPEIRHIIKYYYNKTTENDKYLIKSLDGLSSISTSMTYDKYRLRFKKAMHRIGADDLYSPHCTRHTFITCAKNNNMDEVALKMIVGHEISDITEKVYTHRDSSYLQNEILKIKYE